MTHCPGCGSGRSKSFYRCTDVPVHSVLLMRSREEARAFPKGCIDLALCLDCGLIANRAFDATQLAYSSAYEETQGYSRRFREFQRELAADLVRRHGVHDKRVIEVGCGKGEFLSLLCDLGSNEGLGFDPSYLQERHSNPRMRVVPQFYRAGEPADLVCCKMTLEHVPEPTELLAEIRRGAASDGDSVLFVQVPDAERVLKEGAFWDVYYEHCNYFAGVSLETALERAGFVVERTWRGFDDQYLMIEARGGDAARKGMDRTIDPSELEVTVDRFASEVEAAIASWNEELGDRRHRGERVIVWGGGSKAVAFLAALADPDTVQAVIDINPHRQGTFLAGVGHEIVAPDTLESAPPDCVVIMNPAYVEEISHWLSERRISCAVRALGSASRHHV